MATKQKKFKRGDYVIELSSGKRFIVFDVAMKGTQVCIIDFFSFAEYPHRRQLKIWQSSEGFEKHDN